MSIYIRNPLKKASCSKRWIGFGCSCQPALSACIPLSPQSKASLVRQNGCAKSVIAKLKPCCFSVRRKGVCQLQYLPSGTVSKGTISGIPRWLEGFVISTSNVGLDLCMAIAVIGPSIPAFPRKLPRLSRRLRGKPNRVGGQITRAEKRKDSSHGNQSRLLGCLRLECIFRKCVVGSFPKVAWQKVS